MSHAISQLKLKIPSIVEITLSANFKMDRSFTILYLTHLK